MKPAFLILSIAAGGAIALLATRQAQAAVHTSSGGEYSDWWPDPAPFGDAITAMIDRAAEAVTTPTQGWELPPEGEPYRALITNAARRWGVPEQLLGRLLYQESRFQPDVIDGRVRSAAGAAGIAQFLPSTAAELQINPLVPAQAIDGAARYLASLRRRFGTWSLALAAYNWGQGNLAARGFDQAPAETRAYVAEITTDTGIT